MCKVLWALAQLDYLYSTHYCITLLLVVHSYVSYIKTLMYIVSLREIQYNSFSISNIAHDSFTFPIVNQAVSLLRSDVMCGEMVHCVSTKMGDGFDVYFCNTMIEV